MNRRTEYEVYRERRIALYQTIASRAITLPAQFVDFLIILIPSVVVFFIFRNEDTFAAIFGALLAFFLTTVIFSVAYIASSRKTLGLKLFGVILVNEHTFAPISYDDSQEAYFDGVVIDLMHHDAYEAYQSLTSYTNQSLLMKKRGWLYVEKRKYERFCKEYMTKAYEMKMEQKYGRMSMKDKSKRIF